MTVNEMCYFLESFRVGDRFKNNGAAKSFSIVKIQDNYLVLSDGIIATRGDFLTWLARGNTRLIRRGKTNKGKRKVATRGRWAGE